MNENSGKNTKRESLIVIVSAPSGSGKTTIVDRLLEEIPGIRNSVSYTTRQPREGEKNGKDYVFTTSEDFRNKIEDGQFLEWEEIFDNYYGTPKGQFIEATEGGADIILSIDVKGARAVKKHFPESVSVFIMPPSMEELESRLRKRNTDRDRQVAIRLEESKKEIEAADEYDYLVVNEDLEGAVAELKAIIETERDNRKNKTKKGEE